LSPSSFPLSGKFTCPCVFDDKGIFLPGAQATFSKNLLASGMVFKQRGDLPYRTLGKWQSFAKYPSYSVKTTASQDECFSLPRFQLPCWERGVLVLAAAPEKGTR
jgi:hypothetical protein